LGGSYKQPQRFILPQFLTCGSIGAPAKR